MTSVWNPSENGGRLQSLDLSRKHQDASLHLSTDVSLRGPRMFTQELGNTQNALFLRTHTEKWWGSTDMGTKSARTHTHTPGSYLASVYFVLVGDPVQKLFAHLDWRHCRQKLPVFFALRVQPPQQRHLQDQENVRGLIRRPTRLKKSKEKSLKSVDDTLIKPSLAFWGVKVASELKAPVFSDLSFFKNVLAWTTRKWKHQSGNNDCVNLITICFKRKKSHFQSEATFVPVTPSKLRDNVFLICVCLKLIYWAVKRMLV